MIAERRADRVAVTTFHHPVTGYRGASRDRLEVTAFAGHVVARGKHFDDRLADDFMLCPPIQILGRSAPQHDVPGGIGDHHCAYESVDHSTQVHGWPVIVVPSRHVAPCVMTKNLPRAPVKGERELLRRLCCGAPVGFVDRSDEVSLRQPCRQWWPTVVVVPETTWLQTPLRYDRRITPPCKRAYGEPS